jgi:hypothetical protein
MSAPRAHANPSKQHRNNGERQMAKPIPVSDSHRNGVKADHLTWSTHTTPGADNGLDAPPPSSDRRIWNEQQQAPVTESSNDEAAQTLVRRDRGQEPVSRQEETCELDDTLKENIALRVRLKELEEFLEESAHQNAATSAQLKEYEGLLEEKSEVIRDLHRKMKEHDDKPATPSATPREEELLALSEELERERQQLKEDEETLMQQMRDMEVQMSRERAEIARQRNELQRLQGEIRHELELASRDATLRERLAPLQRRHQELMNRRGGAPASNSAAAPATAAPNEPEQTAGKESGLFRRFFG